MPAANIFESTTGYSSLDKLTQHLRKLKPAELAKLRTALLKQFAVLVEYADANDWSRAVAVCEALAVVGWGKKERVDAISHFNGDCWETYFINAKGEKRYLEARWSKRKKGWQPFNPEYHWSPDRPNAPARDWREYPKKPSSPVALANLPSQTNYERQTPIIMSMFGGLDPVSFRVAKLKEELDALIAEHLRPNEYGPALEFFYLTLHCPAPGSQGGDDLKIGAFRPKQRSYYCDLYFSEAFEEMKEKEQKEYFRSNLLAALRHLEKVFQKKRINYNLAKFRKDIERAFARWINGAAR